MSVVTAEVKVDETDIVNIKMGQPADVTVDAIPNKVFKGHVTLVGDQALLRSTGMATSQSTTGTEEAKDFKVVVTARQPLDRLAPASPPPPRSHRNKSSVLSLPFRRLTMQTPTMTSLRAPAGVQAASSSPATKTPDIQGVFVMDKERPASCASSSSRHHRHHRRHTILGALRSH